MLKGLLELVPLLVTVLVIVYLVNATNNFFRELPFIKDQPWDVPGIGLLILVIIFYLVGLLAIFGVWAVDPQRRTPVYELHPGGPHTLRGYGTSNGLRRIKCKLQPRRVHRVATRRHDGVGFRYR